VYTIRAAQDIAFLDVVISSQDNQGSPEQASKEFDSYLDNKILFWICLTRITLRDFCHVLSKRTVTVGLARETVV